VAGSIYPDGLVLRASVFFNTSYRKGALANQILITVRLIPVKEEAPPYRRGQG